MSSSKKSKSKHSQQKNKLVVSGEDVESDEEHQHHEKKEQQKKNGKGPPTSPPKARVPTPTISVTDTAAQEEKKKGKGEVVVVTYEGEAPESDLEDEFGSTVSLGSSGGNSLELEEGLKLDPEAAAVLAPIFPQRRSPRLDPVLVKKHRDKNRSLRTNVADKFLTPVITQSSKKLEKLSQNLSNTQMQMQDALFQSRVATGNLLKLQKELEAFLEEDYLKELKILPSDDEEGHPHPHRSTSQPDRSEKSSSTNMSSLLSAALSGGAHLI